jgi:putative transposase
MSAAEELGGEVGVAPACAALGVSRATVYRRRQPASERLRATAKSHRALSDGERRMVLDTLNSERFADKAPAEVYASLLEDGTYLCCVSTMYRILRDNDSVRERRNQLQHPNYAKPELLATKPNQLWSWDITKLKGPRKWTYYYLYVILDVFSRYVVGWMVAARESAELAKRLIAETIGKELVDPSQLTIHADRGTSMRSNLVAQLLADLGVTKTHSRPYTSNDNPFSESQFKTLKYRPEFPKTFGSQEDARGFGCIFFPWYNHEHHHHGIALLTPAQVHHGKAEEVLADRQTALDAAFEAHPERFGRRPQAPQLPREVWINPPASGVSSNEPQSSLSEGQGRPFPSPSAAASPLCQAQALAPAACINPPPSPEVTSLPAPPLKTPAREDPP